MKITSVDVGIKKFQPTFQKKGIDHSQKTQIPQVPQTEVKPQSKFKKALPEDTFSRLYEELKIKIEDEISNIASSLKE